MKIVFSFIYAETEPMTQVPTKKVIFQGDPV